MIRLEDLKPGMPLEGLAPSFIATLEAVVPIGDGAVTVYYRDPDGNVRDRLLTRADEAQLSVATAECPWSFDGDGAAFQIACEAKRIDLAFLFDPMLAVHTSTVDPLPHQIAAVYESMLPRQPLRYVLADDPGAGKTIMAGLYIRELLLRADARRILIVAPGSLVEQWKGELFEKFGLEFHVYTSELDQHSVSGNPFEDHHQVIVRLDQVSRNEELQHKLVEAGWDLVVFDEAHKLAAHYSGQKLQKTGRFRLAERVGAATRHLLLMTATPHNGKEEDFQLFLSLLDSDRFYGKFRDGVHKVDVSDLMRRMVKEDLVKFDNTPLFPERRAYTVNYTLSEAEASLYNAVTEYVKTEMGKADELAGPRKGSVGFALTALQRRLASSPEAIYQSLKRRKERLESRLREAELGNRGQQPRAEVLDIVPEDEDDLSAEEQEGLEDKLIELATAAQSIHELKAEILLLQGLEKQARAVVQSGQDRKWDELSRILQDSPEMRNASGGYRKIIIFSEHRDTLNYLHEKIAGVLGNHEAILTIHGSTHRNERQKIQAQFRSDQDVRVLIATDAAGEGVNLQNANLMVNYDLPWNPNRLEQRFGRIHRIGQVEVCHLWNLVAKETREGDVYHRLLEKLQTEREALNNRVFDILGEVFEETSLKDLLIQAIRYGDQPTVRLRLTQTIDHAFGIQHVQSLLDRNALAQEAMGSERLYRIKEEMEKAEARRLQPYFVRSFFMKAFEQLGGTIYPRESGRYEITHVPASIRERDRRITGRNRREQEPVLRRYERVCFEKAFVRLSDQSGAATASLIHPGHPLMLSISDLLLEQHANLLRQGTVFVDPTDEGTAPWLLFLVTHEVKSGDGLVLSKRLQFVRVNQDGSTSFAGWAPHLDLVPLAASDRPLVHDLLNSPWIRTNHEQRAMALAATMLAPAHFQEVHERRIAHVDKTLAAVHERLSKEIAFWSDRWLKLSDDRAAGKDVRLHEDYARRQVTDLEGRLTNRRQELQAMRHVVNATPVVLGGALVVPVGFLRQAGGDTDTTPQHSADPVARSRIERIAMDAVRRREEAEGCHVVDYSAAKCGWDLTSHPPATDNRQPEPRHIEVKGRVHGADTITVTKNEVLYALNQGHKFVLAIVLVREDDSYEGPYYVRNPFARELGWAEASSNFLIADLLKKAELP
jgi:superfamily II DNA or RNA helicase